MNNSSLVTFFKIFNLITSTLGIIFFFINPIFTLICGILSLLNSVVQVVEGEQNNFNTEIATIIICCIIALIFKLNLFYFISFILCVADIVMLLAGWIVVLVLGNKVNSSSNSSTYHFEKSIAEQKLDEEAAKLHADYHRAKAFLDQNTEESILKKFENGDITEQEKEKYLTHIQTAQLFVDAVPVKLKELQQRYNQLY